jgi:hypothetical protein
MGMRVFENREGSRRAVLGGLAAMLAGAGLPATAQRRVPRVLFVCQYGSVKSPIARELLRKRARERRIAVSAFSRGVTPMSHLPSAVSARLPAEGIDPAREGLHRLLPVDAGYADVVVFFNPLPPGFRAARMLDWTAVPSVNETYPAARAELDRRIDRLLDELAR